MPAVTLTPKELAERWRIKVEGVRALCESGRLRAFDVSSPSAKRRRWRVSLAEVERFERGDPIPAPETSQRPGSRRRKLEFAGPF